MDTPKDRLRDSRRKLTIACAVVTVLFAAALWIGARSALSAVQALEPFVGIGSLFVASMALGLGGAASWLLWCVLAPVEPFPLPNFAASSERAVSEIGEPDEIARLTVPLLWERASWIIRRVEYICFLDRTAVRRRVSVDFRVPSQLLEIHFDPEGTLSNADLELLAAGEAGEDDQTDESVRRYVPVSVLRAWPPVLNLDLRDRHGATLPLLSKATTHALDSRLLTGLAEHAFDDYTEDFKEDLYTVVHADGEQAQRALAVVSEAIARVLETVPDIETERADRVLDLGRLLAHSTLLWVPIAEEEGTRQIIKLAYDEPVRRKLFLGLAVITSLGLRGHVVDFEVGQIGDAGSYHLEIDLPFPLELLGAELAITRDPDPGQPKRTVFGRWWAARRLRAGTAFRGLVAGLEHELASALRRHAPRPRIVDKSNFVQLLTRRAHFYATEQRSRPAVASLRMAPERRGIPLTGAVTGILVAVTVTALDANAEKLFDNSGLPGVVGATVAFLLLAPGLVAYVLIRPEEHGLTTRLLSGIRTLTIGSVLLAVAAAGVFIAALVLKDRELLTNTLPVLRTAAWVATSALVLGLVFPLRRRGKRSD